LFPAFRPERGDVRRKRPASALVRTRLWLFCGTAVTDSAAPPSGLRIAAAMTVAAGCASDGAMAKCAPSLAKYLI
ncbi:MAG: hypothetical protein LBF85_09540, partial [Tannerella sp.]|nr:hypothetical protein [Tannerella sp.]